MNNLYLPALQATTIQLDSRVSVLEENGWGDGNSSISELEERVQTLEGITVDQETRIVAAEENIQGKPSALRFWYFTFMDLCLIYFQCI